MQKVPETRGFAIIRENIEVITKVGLFYVFLLSNADNFHNRYHGHCS